MTILASEALLHEGGVAEGRDLVSFSTSVRGDFRLNVLITESASRFSPRLKLTVMRWGQTLKIKKPRREAKLLSSGCIYLPSFSTGLYPDQEESACHYSGIKLHRTVAAYLKQRISTSKNKSGDRFIQILIQHLQVLLQSRQGFVP